MQRLAIFASGSGTNAEALVHHFAGHPEIEIVGIFCNNPSAGVIERATRLDVPLTLFDKTTFISGEITEKLRSQNIDYVILAGFLWLIPANMVSAFPDRIINIHPALLPKFGGKGMYGSRVHAAVRAAGEAQSGITIHLVNEQYDEGKVLFQAIFDISETDTAETIAEKCHLLEHRHFPSVVEDFVSRNEVVSTESV